MPSHSGMGSPFLKLGNFLFSVSLEVLSSHKPWGFFTTLLTIPEIIPIQVEPRNQVSRNREMLAGNHTEWN